MAKKKPSTIEGLQEELGKRQERVEACKKKHEEVVARCQRELEQAQAEVSQYVGMIAEALGLPNPAVREAKRMETLRLRKLVKKLHATGQEAAEIAAKIGAPLEDVISIVDKIVAKQGGGDEGDSGQPEEESGKKPLPGKPLRLPPEAGQKGWKRERVRTLYLEGKVIGEVADAMDISKESVYTHINILRRLGRLPAKENGTPTAPGAPRSPEADDGDDESGDSIADLREELARQQGGNRNAAGRMPTTLGGEPPHDHVAVVDRMGDGQTAPDETEHNHKVYRFVVGRNAGHGHGGLLAKTPGE